MTLIHDLFDVPKPKPEMDGYLLIRREDVTTLSSLKSDVAGVPPDLARILVEEKVYFKDMKGWNVRNNSLWIFAPGLKLTRMIPLDSIIEVKAVLNSDEYVNSTEGPHDEGITCIHCNGVLRG